MHLSLDKVSNTQKYNVPVFIEGSIDQPYCIRPTFAFRGKDKSSLNLETSSADALKKIEQEDESILDKVDFHNPSFDTLKSKNEKMHSARKMLKEDGIFVVESNKDLVRKIQPIFLKCFDLLVYTYSGFDFFFYTINPSFSSGTDSKWEMIRVPYDYAKIQQIIEMHGLLFIFLRYKAVVYNLAF